MVVDITVAAVTRVPESALLIRVAHSAERVVLAAVLEGMPAIIDRRSS